MQWICKRMEVFSLCKVETIPKVFPKEISRNFQRNQQQFTCSKSTREILEKGVKYVQS